MRGSKSYPNINSGTLIYSGNSGEVTRGTMQCAFKKIKETSIYKRELRFYLISSHKNIVKYFGCFPIENLISLELCDTDLFKLIHNPSSRAVISFSKKIKYLLDVVSGMIYIHEKMKSIHGDLKLGNCLLKKNVVKICDFGNSYRINDYDKDVLRGTPNYVMPSLVKSLEVENPKQIDIYAFGFLAWEMFTKKIAFRDMNKNPMELLRFLYTKDETKDILLDLELIKNETIRKLVKKCITRKFSNFIEIEKIIKKIKID